MARLVICLITAAFLAIPSISSAGGYDRHHYGPKFHGHGGFKGFGGSHGFRHHGFKFHGGRHGYKGRGYRHHKYKHRGYKHRGHHKSRRGAYLLGGLVIGSALTYYLNRPRAYSDNYYYDNRSPRYSYRKYPTRTYSSSTVERRTYRTRPLATAPGRHLHKDLEGNCFEIKRNEQGDELRTQLDAAECDW